jgi:hypothetical protein
VRLIGRDAWCDQAAVDGLWGSGDFEEIGKETAIALSNQSTI